MSEIAGQLLASRWSYHDAYPTSRSAVVALQNVQAEVASLVGCTTLELRVRLLELVELGFSREQACQIALA